MHSLDRSLTFSKLTTTRALSSSSQVLSSSFTSCGSSPSRMGGCPLSPTVMCFFWILTSTSRERMGKGAETGTRN